MQECSALHAKLESIRQRYRETRAQASAAARLEASLQALSDVSVLLSEGGCACVWVWVCLRVCMQCGRLHAWA